MFKMEEMIILNNETDMHLCMVEPRREGNLLIVSNSIEKTFNKEICKKLDGFC